MRAPSPTHCFCLAYPRSTTLSSKHLCAIGDGISLRSVTENQFNIMGRTNPITARWACAFRTPGEIHSVCKTIRRHENLIIMVPSQFLIMTIRNCQPSPSRVRYYELCCMQLGTFLLFAIRHLFHTWSGRWVHVTTFHELFLWHNMYAMTVT